MVIFMIYGIGMDMIELSRIESSVKKEGFLEKIFAKDEIESFFEKPGGEIKLAGCFAAKEALSKALGTGFRGFWYNEISVLRDELGKPYFKLNDRAKTVVDELNVNLFVTITNTKDYAAAVVVLEVA